MKVKWTITIIVFVAGLSACTKGFNISSDDGKKTNSSSGVTAPSTEAFTSVITSGATQLSSGLYQSCAKVNEKLQCWGVGPNGESGPNLDPKWTPQTVLNSVTAFHASKLFSCGVESGVYKCWGSNSSGVMGDLGFNAAGEPPIALLAGIAQFAAGAEHSCLIAVAGGLYCMGQARCGQMSDGMPHDTNDYSDKQSSAKLVVSSGVLSVHSSSSSNRTCLITTGGEVKCWGASGLEYKSEACSGDLNPMATVPGLTSGVTDIAVSGTHTCAVQGGKLLCWGANEVGQLGLGTTTDQASPQLIPNFTADVTRVIANYDTTCAIKAGDLYCWGQDRFRRTNNFSIPLAILAPKKIATGVTDASIYANGMCFISGGAVRCSGNVFNELTWK